jgi:hypothetical protein
LQTHTARHQFYAVRLWREACPPGWFAFERKVSACPQKVGGVWGLEGDLRKPDRSGAVDSPTFEDSPTPATKIMSPLCASSGFGTVRHLEITPGTPSVPLPDFCSRTKEWLARVFLPGGIECPWARTPLGAQREASHAGPGHGKLPITRHGSLGHVIMGIQSPGTPIAEVENVKGFGGAMQSRM